ncbi:MAG: hypothetical protein KGI91_13240 [Burkholderiales bacterium]|jgi:hypothetical protein|uniref:Uncharacterized protein n=1 Tax=Aquabacterium olei TaxID=1296669 RepID=A0A2U8FRQ7_9BURK|nr:MULTISPECIES: hypothetical protein [Aquabacterium]AWI53488.1 hypothetical protein DEH84_08650 [Aquabacterium olei]MBI3383396.1 hypothetical protein [Aquabacterium sp.]MDE2078017.1 hypothetical protein [Burkholderiales bacterium]
MTTVTLNLEQKLYVITERSGHSCFGFDNARDHANQIAQQLDQSHLAFAPGDYATLAGYQKYLMATAAWGRSPQSQRTYFAPGTDPRAAKVLESYRRTGEKIRLILGDLATGEPWLDEHGVVGRIGRSGGMLKIPLLVEPGQSGGGAILTDCILCLVDWQTGNTPYRHPAYREANLSLSPNESPNLPWAVRRGSDAIACFADIGKAASYLAFMRGATIEPRVFA